MTELGANRYGKQAIRVVKVVRGRDHRVRDLTVGIVLEGDFAAAHVSGDNTNVVATDTMKNTVYALAKDGLTGAIEDFGRAIAGKLVAYDQTESATVTIREHGWRRLTGPGGPAPDAFRRAGDWTRMAVVRVDQTGTTIDSGVEDLVVLKTGKSAFSGFPRDELTTLPETRDRLLSTRVTASWRHGATPSDWDASHATLLRVLLETYADHESESVQHSIFLMARAMLAADPEITEVRMMLPNIHHWLVDLAPFGLENPGEVFVATSEPYGLIEATVRRGEA